jgi:hypothetical protein
MVIHAHTQVVHTRAARLSDDAVPGVAQAEVTVVKSRDVRFLVCVRRRTTREASLAFGSVESFEDLHALRFVHEPIGLRTNQ